MAHTCCGKTFNQTIHWDGGPIYTAVSTDSDQDTTYLHWPSLGSQVCATTYSGLTAIATERGYATAPGFDSAQHMLYTAPDLLDGVDVILSNRWDAAGHAHTVWHIDCRRPLRNKQYKEQRRLEAERRARREQERRNQEKKREAQEELRQLQAQQKPNRRGSPARTTPPSSRWFPRFGADT